MLGILGQLRRFLPLTLLFLVILPGKVNCCLLPLREHALAEDRHGSTEREPEQKEGTSAKGGHGIRGLAQQQRVGMSAE